MNSGLFSLALLLLAGLSLGSVYFGGLWITLRRLPRWRRPFLRMGLSLLGRLAVLLGGGAWLLQHAIAPPLAVILLISVGVWLSRTLLVAQLLTTVERSTKTVHPAAHH
ncbi:MAG: ATP synthase subunit I [Cyanobacteria bacterium J06639_16]